MNMISNCNQDPLRRAAFGEQLLETRREFFGRAARGIGGLALLNLLGPGGGSTSLRAAETTHPALRFGPKAKRVIYLYMAGGPSHLESFDYKPELLRFDGQKMPDSIVAGQPVAQLQNQDLIAKGPMFQFKRHGASGQEVSELFPHIGAVSDQICIVRSMLTEQINHDPAHTFMNTGSSISGRPSMGAWMTYGLGSEAEDLPGFVVMTSAGGGQMQPIAARQWHSGFLPSRHQGVEFRAQDEPVLYVKRPDGVSEDAQKQVIDGVRNLSLLRNQELDDSEIAGRISQYEMAFRMQTSVPEIADISKEPQHVLDLYGVDGLDGSFAANCLLARRLAERGVRFIQLYHRGWDHHRNLRGAMPVAARKVDQASAALIQDLAQRGMLEDTLVVWGGEFGRTPMAQGDGRDHHIKGFSMWLAGGGIKPGITYGATDDFGYNARDNIVHVHDLHATMLRLFGIDHTRLTYRFQGRDFRLTDVAGEGGGGDSQLISGRLSPGRFNPRNRARGLVLPCVRSARTSPSTLAILKPCPERPAARTICSCSGCRSTTKCSSGVQVYMQAA